MQKRESNQPSKRRGRKPKAKPEGLGDVVEIITEATGIKKLVKLFTPDGEDCGCDKRKETLNKIFPFPRHRPSKCMNQEQYERWESVKDIKKHDRKEYLDKVYPATAKLHAELFSHKHYSPCTCSPKIWDQWRKDLNNIFKIYEEQAD
jgi:hypothetical protein